MTEKKSPSSSRPIIIGGGISGLIAAVHLAERGLKPLLLEAETEYIGGRLKGGEDVEIKHNGQLWHFPNEHGIHGIWSPYRNFREVLTRYNINPAFVPAHEESWIFGRGKKIRKAAVGNAIRHSIVPAPFHYLFLFTSLRFMNILTLRDVASMFRVFGSLISAMSINPLAEHKPLKNMSLADFMAGWSPTLQSFFAGLARNALAGHAEDVPASGFISFLRFYTLLRRDDWVFDYLPGSGGACVSEPLADIIRKLGGEIRMGAKVISLERNKMSWQILYENNGEKRHIIEAEQIILAVDAPAAKKLLQESPATSKLAADLYFPTGVPTAIIRLWFKRKPVAVSEAGICTGDFVMDNFFWLDRLQTDYIKWSNETGGSAVEMHIYGPPELLEQPDATLLARVMLDTYRAFPKLRGNLLHSILLRNEATHTLFSIGEPGKHPGIETVWPDLFMCGDWVYHPSPALYLERATVTGIAAANALLSSLNVETWPVLPHPKPEWLAGKMEKLLRWVRLAMAGRKQG